MIAMDVLSSKDWMLELVAHDEDGVKVESVKRKPENPEDDEVA